MVRKVILQDAAAIAEIYNEYVMNSSITFETDEVSVEEMQSRIQDISSEFPYYVYEKDGIIVGYCYAHAWKKRAAYRYTLETTVYLSPNSIGKGIGMILMTKLIKSCAELGYHSLVCAGWFMTRSESWS